MGRCMCGGYDCVACRGADAKRFNQQQAVEEMTMDIMEDICSAIDAVDSDCSDFLQYEIRLPRDEKKTLWEILYDQFEDRFISEMED